MVTCAMPRETFECLPEEKRMRFVAAAIDEFSAAPYRQASITRLVARLQIAKGSVYQYFDNKMDLYQWLLTTEVERHRALHMRGAAPERGDIFSALSRYAAANLAFHLAEPKLAQLARYAFSPGRDVELKELHASIRRKQLVFFMNFVERGQAAGLVRLDLDVEFTARLIAHAVGDALVDTALAAIDCDLATYLDVEFGRADALTDERLAEWISNALTSIKGAFGETEALVGAIDSGSGLALGERSSPPQDAPLGVAFVDDDAVALADEWWSHR